MRYEFTRNGTLVGRFQTYRVAKEKFFSMVLKPWTRCDDLRVVDTKVGNVILHQRAA